MSALLLDKSGVIFRSADMVYSSGRELEYLVLAGALSAASPQE